MAKSCTTTACRDCVEFVIVTEHPCNFGPLADLAISVIREIEYTH